MKTIVWDVDDVLNELMKTWLDEVWNAKHPDSPVLFQSLRENPPHEVINITLDEYLKSLDEFRSTRFAGLKPVPQVLRWFQEYGHRFRNIALTAVPAQFSGISASWVFEHFGPWIRSFNFVPSPRPDVNLPTYDANKMDYLRWLGKADILVDDNMKTVAEAEKAGVRAFLVKQPWNMSTMDIADILAAVTESAG